MMVTVFNGVKVFSATMVQQRQALGDQITAWIATERRQRPGFAVVDIVMRQSSDSAFHCVSAILFFKYDVAAKETRRG